MWEKFDMNKEQIKKLAQNPHFISGIYNYCDRWCERCPFTARCMNYALSETEFSDPQTRDLDNKQFWDKLHEIFQVTKELFVELAQERGIDLTDVDSEKIAEEERLLDEEVENHPCSKSGMKYIKIVNEWFDASGELFREKENELNKELELDLPGSSPMAEATGIGDSVEVIRWYQYQIYVKIKRALSGKGREEFEELNDFPKDSDGSAKVALIGIDRSIAAWGNLKEQFPERGERIFDILLHLDRLRRSVEAEFPEARKFVRPGFDEATE